MTDNKHVNTNMFRRVQGAIDAELKYSIDANIVEKCARAAIEALRVPTREMTLALESDYAEFEATAVWQAMVDVILSGGKDD